MIDPYSNSSECLFANNYSICTSKECEDKFFLEPQSNLFLGCGHTNLISRALRKTGEQKE